MNQRFTLDRKSFEQFLAAVSLLQQLKKQAASKRALNEPSQPLVSLLQLQRAINAGTVDMDSAMSAVVRLTRSVLGATSAGIWLFRSTNEFSCCARVGTIYDPERLGTDILARLADSGQEDSHSLNSQGVLRKASHYPGYPNSIAISVLRIGGKVVGAVAAFSVEFDAFSGRDLDNLNFLASLLQQAIEKAIRLGYSDAVALEHTAMLQLLTSIVPHLKEQLRLRTSSRHAAPRNAYAPGNQGLAGLPETPRKEISSQGHSPEAMQAPGPLAAKDPVGDVSLPGIGVRAALGDVPEYTGNSESSFSWGNICAPVVRLAANCRSGMSRIYAAGLIRLRTSAARVMNLPGQLTRPRFSVPGVRAESTPNPVAGLSKPLHAGTLNSLTHLRATARPHIQFAWVRNTATRLRTLSRSVVVSCEELLSRTKAQSSHRLRVGRIQLRAFRRSMRQTRADLTALLTDTRIKVRITSRRQKRVLASSAEATGDALHHAGESLAGTAAYAGRSTLTALHVAKTRLVPNSSLRFNKYALRRAGSAVVVLVVMAIFLAMETGVRTSFHSEPVSASSTAATIPASSGTQLAFATTTAAHQTQPGPTSHLEITDSSVSDELHNLTRYEVVTLQRAANYGDDEAAFQLGMAYETGYYVRQNCSKAARWVKMAAEEGNAAAAYNLALRYRQGDGLAADESAAAHWFQAAAGHKYSPAKLASAEER